METEFKTFKINNFGKSKTIKVEWQINVAGEIRKVIKKQDETVIKPVNTYLSGGRPGSQYVCMSVNDEWKYLHRTIAKMFIPNPNNYPTVDHINGNKLDNSISNLRWCTYSENTTYYWNTLAERKNK